MVLLETPEYQITCISSGVGVGNVVVVVVVVVAAAAVVGGGGGDDDGWWWSWYC